MKRGLLIGIGALLFALALGGFLVAASGIASIKASSGHWAITAWLLHFSMKRSVFTHSFFIDPPPLDDPALVLKGAAHYDTGCRPCHGSPELPHPPITQRMTPPPPYLPPKIPEWEPEELFYLVKHGVKFTGMPAWPAPQRDDEVWAMVAFLRRFPALDAAEYRRLASGSLPGETPALRSLDGPEDLRATLRESCARCHGAHGLGGGAGAFPRLAGQRPVYLRNALEAFARGKRHSGIMQPIAATLSRAAIRELADHFAGLSPPAQPSRGDAAAIARGEAIAQLGVPRQRVPSCADCHGPNPRRRNAAFPRLAGQYADYLVLQLELLRDDQRGGSPYARLMRPIAGRLRPEQMRDVALYYESLTPARDSLAR